MAETYEFWHILKKVRNEPQVKDAGRFLDLRSHNRTFRVTPMLWLPFFLEYGGYQRVWKNSADQKTNPYGSK